MSLDATIWAWKKKFTQEKGGSSPALKKLVLLSMADRADEQHCCYPSSARLADDCQINKKTLFKILDELISEGLIFDTGERKGKTKQVIVYRLIGVQGRENTVPTLEQLDGESLDTQGEDSQTVPTLEQYQHFQQTVPTLVHGIYQVIFQMNLKIKNLGFVLQNFVKKFYFQTSL